MKEASMKLTSSEKFDLVSRITELVNIDVLLEFPYEEGIRTQKRETNPSSKWYN